VIAGDLYDGKWKDYTTGLFFVAEMGRLARAGIPVFVLHGNHDAESQIIRKLTLPDNVRVFSARRPETFRVAGHAVALHGQSFADRAVTDNLAAAYPDADPGLFNIGVLHTAMEGAEDHAPYAPCRRADLLARDYHYWALGHVHAGQVLHEYPHIVFPGNLQGRHIRETGPKGFRLITVADGHVAAAEFIAVDVVRWARVAVDVGGAADFAAVLDRVRPALGQAIDDADGRLAALRVVLTGRTAAHHGLKADPDRLLSECQAAALLYADAVWIEKVRVETRPPRAAADDEFAPGDAVGLLLGTIDTLSRDDAMLAALNADLADLLTRLPTELRRVLEHERNALDPALLAEIMGEARALIGARVLDGEGAA
jgi:DNA repair exonuclease SbcCD nuclease subunit